MNDLYEKNGYTISTDKSKLDAGHPRCAWVVREIRLYTIGKTGEIHAKKIPTPYGV
jgi:hypothetical protein